MSRQPSPLVAQRNEGLLQRIRERKAEPPFWGYRRIWATVGQQETDLAVDAGAPTAGHS
jgi:hypothetical protein